MAKGKINVDVAIDSAAFVKFFDTFQSFRAAVDAQPEAWKKVGEAGAQSAASFAGAADSVRQLADSMDAILGRQNSLEQASRNTASHWTRLARATKDAASHIKDATQSLWSWRTLFYGIVGVGSLGIAGIAIDRFALGIGRNRSFALGTGTSYGNLQAFRTNYGSRIGDAEGLLARVNEARTSVQGRQAFYGVGMSERDMEGDNADVSARFITKLEALVDRTPTSTLANVLEQRHLTDIVSVQMAQLLKSLPREDREKMLGGYLADRQSMGLTEKVQREWQDFATRLGRSGVQIETIFVKNLANVEPGLERLSGAVVKVADTLLKEDGPVAHWLEEANHALEVFADYVKTPEFTEKVRDFVHLVGDIAQGAAGIARSVGQFLHWFAGALGSDFKNVDVTGDDYALSQNGNALAGTGAQPGGATPHAAGRGVVGMRRSVQTTPGSGGGGGGGTPRTRGKWWTDERIRHAYDVLTKGGLSPLEAQAQIARMAYVEAGAGPTAANASGHLGIFQADRARQRDFGGSTDFDDQLQAIVKEKRGSEAASHRMGLAAKNDYDAARSASMFERGERYNRSTGEDAFTGTTARYVPHVRDVVTPRAPARVVVNHATGGSPAPQVAAAAAPP